MASRACFGEKEEVYLDEHLLVYVLSDGLLATSLSLAASGNKIDTLNEKAMRKRRSQC